MVTKIPGPSGGPAGPRTPEIEVENALPPPRAGLGLVRAAGLAPGHYPAGFEAALAALLDRRQADLAPHEEATRKAARDLLRNGRYKPTGRGKPASEYLLRAAREGAFPRINPPVDLCNFISLKYVLPISIWDLGRVETRRFRFRLGSPDEVYVFNTAGQTIALEDLVVGCRADTGTPIVNPVKDSMATKTHDETTEVAAVVYAPLGTVPEDQLGIAVEEFARWLGACGPQARAVPALARPGETVRL